MRAPEPQSNDPRLAQSVLEAMEMGAVVLDSGRRIRCWNGWMARACGIDAVTALGREFLAVFPGLIGTRLEAAIEDALQRGAAAMLTHALNPGMLPLRRRDGRVMHHNVTVRPLPGEQQCCLVQVNDVSAAVERERTLRLRQDARYRAVVDAAVDAIVTTGPDDRIEWVNAATERRFGRSAAELVGQEIEVLLPKGGEQWRTVAARPGTPESFEVEGRRADGTQPILEVAVARWTAGGHAFATGILRDVTERRRAAEALRESEERLRLAISAARMYFWDWNILTGEVAWSEGLEEACGLPPGSFGGSMQAFRALLYPEDWPKVEAALDQARSGARDYEAEFRMMRGDGRIRWVFARGTVLRDASGRAVRMVGIDFDITERKQLEEALARSNADLERRVAERTRALSEAARELAAEMRRREEAQSALLQAQKLEALGQLTGGVAHDFNNVLAAVLGSYRLIRRLQPAAEVLELVRHGEGAAERAVALVRQLLAFARREELRPALVDPAALLPQLELLARHTIGSRIRIELQAEPGVWPVLVDSHRLEVALLNLVVNARDAMPTGGQMVIQARNLAPGEAAAFGWTSGDAVLFSVCDSGSGMTPEVLARASEPFFTTKGVGKGTGLGLAMVRGFAEQSGGAFHIASRPGEGCTVSILLPRAALPAHEGLLGAELAELPFGADAVILLVDDDDQVRPITAAMLRDLGYRVVEAANAEAGFALAHATEPLDLVVSDVVMPGADGPTLAARLRAERPGLPILFITAHVGAARLAEGEVVLHKPFTQRALAEKVAELLRRRAAGR